MEEKPIRMGKNVKVGSVYVNRWIYYAGSLWERGQTKAFWAAMENAFNDMKTDDNTE